MQCIVQLPTIQRIDKGLYMLFWNIKQHAMYCIVANNTKNWQGTVHAILKYKQHAMYCKVTNNTKNWQGTVHAILKYKTTCNVLYSSKRFCNFSLRQKSINHLC